MKTNLYFLTGLIMLGITACNNNTKTQQKQPKTIMVQTAVANYSDEPLTFALSGTVEAEQQSILSTRQSGQISKILAIPGTQVKKGDLLIQLRQADLVAQQKELQASIKSSQALFQISSRDLERYKALHKAGSASDKELENAQSSYQQNKALLTSLQEKETTIKEALHYTSIRAPFSGLITEKYAETGDLAMPGKPLIALENTDQWKIALRIPESIIPLLKINDSIPISIPALNLHSYGFINELNPADTRTGTPYTGKVLIISPESVKLYSGLYAQAKVISGHTKRLMVPQTAVYHQGELTGLFVNQENKTAFLRWVRTGIEENDSIEILSGLKSGESYISPVSAKLHDGAAITVSTSR